MKKSLPYLLIFVFSNMLMPVLAQVSNVTVDTTIVSEGQTGEYEPGEDEATEDVNTNLDSLKWELRTISKDSVLAITGNNGFYYKNYLDSLLRATQAKPIVKKKPKEPRISSRNLFDSVFGVLFWILAVGLFGYLVYKLFLSNSSLFSRNRKNIASDISIEEKEMEGDSEALLRNAIRNGNYRMAVRYLYLQTLSGLADRKLITINANKTNYEYVKELRRQNFTNEFASLTLKYEYVWYGEYPVDEKLFKQLEAEFNQFNKIVAR